MRLMLLIGMGSNSLQQLLIYFYSKIHSGFYTHNFIRNKENEIHRTLFMNQRWHIPHIRTKMNFFIVPYFVFFSIPQLIN